MNANTIYSIAERVQEILCPHDVDEEIIKATIVGAINFTQSHGGFVILLHKSDDSTLKTIEVFALQEKKK